MHVFLQRTARLSGILNKVSENSRSDSYIHYVGMNLLLPTAVFVVPENHQISGASYLRVCGFLRTQLRGNRDVRTKQYFRTNNNNNNMITLRRLPKSASDQRIFLYRT